jgi:hypothetical protein
MDKMHHELQKDSSIDDNLKMKHELTRKNNEVMQLSELLDFKNSEISGLKSKVDEQRTLSRAWSSECFNDTSTLNFTPEAAYGKSMLLEHKGEGSEQPSKFVTEPELELNNDNQPKLRSKGKMPETILEDMYESQTSVKQVKPNLKVKEQVEREVMADPELTHAIFKPKNGKWLNKSAILGLFMLWGVIISLKYVNMI